MSRTCKVSTYECNNPNHICNFVDQSDIKELTDLIFHGNNDNTDTADLNEMKKDAREALHELSSTVVENSFYLVDFGGDFFSIYRCSPSDMMHAFLQGVLKLIVKIFIDPLKPKTKEAVDLIIYLDSYVGQRR
jgi:hypothetical protein